MTNCPHCQSAIAPESTFCPRCGASLSESGRPSLLVDGRYAVESELGRGAMGVVHLARDVGLGRQVALKLIYPRFAQDARYVERFRREASALASLRHEHVVEVYAFGRHEDSYYFAMEYIAGKSLEQIVVSHAANNSFVPISLALPILSRIARGLESVHASGQLHRDVKPGNIVIENRTGRAVLVDFGLVKTMHSGEQKQTDVVGSPPYMAPEQIVPSRAPDGLTARTDVYALGCTAFELLTGRVPFEGGSIYEMMHAHLTEPPPLVSKIRPDSEHLDSVIAKAMAKDPSQRFASSAAFATEIDRLIARWRRTNPTPPPGPLEPEPVRAGLLRLLIVDDNDQFRTVVGRTAQHAFAAMELDIQHAASGLEAIHRVRHAAPDVIVLDFDMPGMNGVETLGLLRAQPGIANTPAIVCTANPEASIRWKFELLGVTEYLIKPAKMDAITKALQRTLADKPSRS